MENERNRILRKIQVLTYVVFILSNVLMIFLDANGVIELKSGVGFIIFGVTLILIGIFGLLNHEITLRNAKSIRYNKNSGIGKAINVIISSIGVFNLIIGLIGMCV